MNTKRLLPALLAAAVMAVPAAQASDNETVFLPAQGKLVIPHLRLNNEIYFVILERTSNPAIYNFNLLPATITKITPQPGDDWATELEIIGDWTIPELPGVSLGIFASGEYSITTPAEDGCDAGTETGTWTLDEETGVFFPIAVTDANGECGLSHPSGVSRMKRDGANLKILLNEEDNGVQQVIEITAVPE